MNSGILNTEVQNFINQNLNTDLPGLVLKGSPFPDLTIQELAQQIAAKKAAIKKLPTWFHTADIYYPDKLNIEQCSSEITAKYKSSLISGNNLLDLTGGLGVDSYYFAGHFDSVVHCESDSNLSLIAQYNFKQLNKNNLSFQNTDGIKLLEKKAFKYDWIFVDPSRRSDHNRKVFLLEDCQPDMEKHEELLLSRSDKILIKLSPMLDLKSVVDRLHSIYEIHVVAVQNEVKELLILIRKGNKEPILIKTINILEKGQHEFESFLKSSIEPSFSAPKSYLFEPNAAIMKAGLFNELSNEMNLHKIHINSHLYTSDLLISFPGRRFKINKISRYNTKRIRKEYGGTKANITTRNFRYPVEEIRKTTRIKEGGETYLFFTTDPENKPIVINCTKV